MGQGGHGLGSSSHCPDPHEGSVWIWGEGSNIALSVFCVSHFVHDAAVVVGNGAPVQL